MTNDTDPKGLEGDRATDHELDGLAYADAVNELEQILAELEDDDIDVDRLTTRVRRAAALIALCRQRILDARVEIEQILGEPDG